MRKPKLKWVLKEDNLKILSNLMREPKSISEIYSATKSQAELLSDDKIYRHLVRMETKDMGFVKKLATGKWELTKKGMEVLQAKGIVMGEMDSQNKSAIDKKFEFGIFHVQGFVASHHTAGTLIAAILSKTTEPPTGSITGSIA